MHVPDIFTQSKKKSIVYIHAPDTFTQSKKSNVLMHAPDTIIPYVICKCHHQSIVSVTEDVKQVIQCIIWI